MGYAAPAALAATEADHEPSDRPRPERVDPDAVDDLGDEIATLAAHIHAGTRQLLTLLARFDRLRGWERAGHRSCAHWLAFRTGFDLGTAREHVRVARALEGLPRTGAAMARGALSFSQVRALTRVADAKTEGDLLELAEGCTTAQLERVVRAWKKSSRADEAAWARERHRSRAFSVFPDDDGMYVVQGRLDPEVGALLLRALEAASDTLYRERRQVRDRIAERTLEAETGQDHPGVYDTARDAARRRADAIGLLAERALAVGFGPTGSGDGADSVKVPISGTRGERYQVVLHVDPDTLAEDGEPGRAELEDGTRVSAETCRRLACDASLVRVERAVRTLGDSMNARGSPVLNVGRKTRTISPALRRALEVRDRGCRFPGCGLRFTEAHHVVHWADGGETSLENTLLLCRYHHRLVHEEGWDIEWWGMGRPAFRDPRGWVHAAGSGRPPPRIRDRPEAPLDTLRRTSRLNGVRPDAWTAGARWRREADIPDEVLFRAIEAAL